MAFYLAFGGNDSVTYSTIPIVSTDDFELFLDARMPIESSYRLVGSNAGATSSRVFIFSNGLIRLSSEAAVNRQWQLPYSITLLETMRFYRVNGTLKLDANGVTLTETFNSNTDEFNFQTFGTHDGFFGSPFDLYSATIDINGTPAHNYDPSASNGTGQILPDTAGSNDGTLVNFPTDDSQWVFYDDGGGAVTADTVYNVNAPTFTSSASVTLPAPIADASFTLAAPTFSALANASLPQPIANAAFTLNAPAFSATASVEATPSGDLYYLNFATDGYVSFSPLVSDIGADYSWDIEFRAANNQPVEFILLGESSVIENVIVLRSDNTIDYRVNSLELAFPVTDTTDESAIYRFEARGGGISLYENGELKATRVFSNVQVGGTNGGFAHIGDAGGVVARGGALYYLKYTDNNNPANNRFFNPSASNGTGDVLPDTASGLDATQVDTWPSDDSEWVQYASATPSADVSFTLNTPVFAASADATLPQPSASIEYSINAPTFAADATVTLPNPTVDVSYTVTAPTFSVDASVIETGVKSDLLFLINQPTFSANAIVTLPDVVAECNISIAEPTFSVSCSVPAPRLQPRKTISVSSKRHRTIKAGSRPTKTIRVN